MIIGMAVYSLCGNIKQSLSVSHFGGNSHGDNVPPVQQVTFNIVRVKQLRYFSFLCFIDLGISLGWGGYV